MTMSVLHMNTEEEIRRAVWDCDNLNIIDLDGINIWSIKEFWEVIKGNFIIFITKLHANRRLVKGVNKSFITLIQKMENPMKQEEFRPISLVKCMYKVLVKLFANRQKKVVHKVISESLFAFLEGQQIGYCILTAIELVDDVKRSKC